MDTLPRTLEPEVMDSPEEARDYDGMDHSEVNGGFCDAFVALCPHPGRLLDAGTGTALIPIELCRRTADADVHAIDLAPAMLAIAKRNVERAGLGARVHLELADAKATRWDAGAFDAVVSNSLVHHVADPGRLLRELRRLVRPGGVLFVRDLARPDSTERVRDIVETYAPLPASADPKVIAMHERQRALFEASLHAALTLEEVTAIVRALGVPGDAVQATSDRHWTLAWIA